MSTIADDVRNILILEAFATEATKLAAIRRRSLDERARKQLNEEGIAPSWELPNVAKVTLALTKQALFVADVDKLTAWMGARRPEAVEQVAQLKPGAAAQLVGTLIIDGDVAVDPETGEIVPGIGVRKGGQPKSLSVVQADGVKAVVAAQVAQMLTTAHPAIAGPVEQPSAPDSPWVPAGDPWAAFTPAVPA